VLIIENSIPTVHVLLQTIHEYVCCDSPFDFVGTVSATMGARGGTGGAIDAFDSAFLTLTLPPGYSLAPGSLFLSKPFAEPQPVPEPWTTPFATVVMICFAVWRLRVIRPTAPGPH
jgi:hypothetical protein